MADEIFHREREARRRVRRTLTTALAGAKLAKDTYDFYSAGKGLYEYATGNKSITEYGAEQLKEDTYGLIDITEKKKKKKNNIYYNKMPRKHSSGSTLKGANRFKLVSYCKDSSGKMIPVKTRGRPRKVNKVPLKKQVKQLQKSLKSDQAYHTFKISEAGPLLASVAKCNHRAFSLGTISNLQSAMAHFRYYNPSVPGTLTTADASTGTYSRMVHCLGITYTLTARNNYQVPCKYRIYKVEPKADTSIDAITYFTNGITDQVQSSGAPDDETPQVYLTEIDAFKSQWRAKVLKSGILEAGRQVSVSFKSKSFDFDPSVFDTHNLEYQTKYGSGLFIIRVEGVVGHDTTVADYTTLAAGLDLEGTRIYKFVYDAGTNLNDIYITDNRDTSFTNAGVVSNKAVADNQSYSVA